MEIIDNPNKNNYPDRNWAHHIYLGVALIVVGVIWMLHNFDAIPERFFDIFFSWQMLVIVIGGYLMALKRWAAGGITMAVGLFFLATEWLFIDIPLYKVALPIVCIASGLAVILGRKNR